MWNRSRPSSSTTHKPAGQYSENFPKLALLFDDLRLVLGQRGDVVDPEHALAADEADVAAAIGDLHVGQQQMQQPAALGPPDHPFVQDLAALLAQLRNDAGPLLEVVPVLAGIAELELFLAVA